MSLKVLFRFFIVLGVILSSKELPFFGNAVAGFILGYFISAYAEWMTHVFVMHPSKQVLKFLNSFNNPDLTLPFRSHAGHHHGIFSEKNYSVENNFEWNTAITFENKKDRIILNRDAVANRHGDDPRKLHESNYGMSLNDHEFYWSNVRIFLITVLVCWIFGLSLAGFIFAFLIAPAATILNKHLHLYAHTPKWMIERDGGWFMRFLIKTSYWRLVSRRHYQHHLTPQECNFCLFLPGPDWIMGTGKDPSESSKIEMERLGFLY